MFFKLGRCLRLPVCLPFLTEKGSIAFIWVGLGASEEDVLAKVTQSLQGHGVIETAHANIKCGGTGGPQVCAALLRAVSAVSTRGCRRCRAYEE